MDVAQLEEVDRTLLFISEAREQAERTARSLSRENGDPQVVRALEDADRALHGAYNDLMRDVYFPVNASQLKLAG